MPGKNGHLPSKTAASKTAASKTAASKTAASKEGDPWQDQPELVKQFIERRPDYEQLCGEVAYILKRRLQERNTEFAAVTHRAKTLNSFLDKIQRKSYESPLVEISDFAGVRVVSLYPKDLAEIEAVISDEFVIVEKVDKLNEKDVDQFGYGAIHFVVRLGPASSGARYDALKDLTCEIQTRTVLQDAWAIIQHHLVYKHESDVPEPLQQKLNGLAGLFETADDQFQNVYNARAEYLSGVRDLINDPERFLQIKVNVDSLSEYLAWKFPEQRIETRVGVLAEINASIDHRKFRTLEQLDNAFAATVEDREVLREENGPRWRSKNKTGELAAVAELVWAIGIVDANFRQSAGFPPPTARQIAALTK